MEDNIENYKKELQDELKEINAKLRWLLKRGCNDENLVNRKRYLEKLI